jgi:hypothetical protein
MITVESDHDARLPQILHRLRQFKSDMAPQQSMHHRCGSGTCNPQSEPDLVSNPMSSNVYLCRFGTHHVCSQSSCRLYSETREQTCPISGIQYEQLYSSYNKNDPKTWNARAEAGLLSAGTTGKKRAKKSKSPADVPISQVKERSGVIVEKLLFSWERTLLNQKYQTKLAAEARKERELYVQERSECRQMPHLVSLVTITAKAQSAHPPPMTIFEPNPLLVQHYIAIVAQVWRMLIDNSYTSEPRMDIETVTLGTLYWMRTGLRIEEADVVVLPKDDFLLHHLPALPDLSDFGYDRGRVTHGLRLIQQTCMETQHKSLDMSHLSLKFEDLPRPEDAVRFIPLKRKKANP